MEMEAPSLEKVEEKIQGRLAEAKARTELREATPEGAEAELKEAISLAQADARLEELKRELGLAVEGDGGGQAGTTEVTPQA
jgi:phage shock protein A